MDKPYLTAMNASHNETINNYLTKENIFDEGASLEAARTKKAERCEIERTYKQISQENNQKAYDELSKSVTVADPLQQELQRLEGVLEE